jgi:uncharacterized RDD family membrane protein YckC
MEDCLMRWAEEIKIETPEQIDVALEVAGIGSRYMAQAIDWAVKFVAIFAIAIVGVIVVALLDLQLNDRTAQAMAGALFLAAAYLLALGFDIYFEVRRDGQTPGKMVAGIRVIREGGGAIDFASASVRNLVGLADFLPFFYLLGALVMMLNAKGQRLGDMAAGTLVIRERALAPPGQDVEVASRFATDEVVLTSQELSVCGPADRHLLKSFFQRYPAMDERARERLATTLANEFVRRTSFRLDAPRATQLAPEAFLASLYRDLEAAARHER